ncbi:hypothetical protein UYSO10_4185 [Kosakonia radicincitans]|nr:hypothetical protein UYSO10_4185 [Kosakonia radicincitans]
MRAFFACQKFSPASVSVVKQEDLQHKLVQNLKDGLRDFIAVDYRF